MSNLPDRFVFPLKVYYADTDSAGIVYYGTYMRWMEMGRCEFFAQNGFDLTKRHEDGLILVVANANLNYKKPARLGDVLDMAIAITEVTGLSFKFNYRFWKTTQGGDRDLLVEAQTLMVCVDRHNFKLQSLPPSLLSILDI